VQLEGLRALSSSPALSVASPSKGAAGIGV
jgi:hypothetical protein